MSEIQIGRICVKTVGRERGKECVIIDIIDKNFLLITGPKSVSGVKRRRVNVKHIEPLEGKIEISQGSSDEEIANKLNELGKTKN